MTRRRKHLAICAVVLSIFGVPHDAPARPRSSVLYTSECTCEGNHGVSRWAVKTDLSEPPTSGAEIQAITPATICSWSGPGSAITRASGRTALENRWFAVTGRLTKVKVEDDGDLHLVLEDINGAKRVIVEVPLGERWCPLRKTVFSWTDATFPLATGRSPFQSVQDRVITVVGKAFYDVDHAGADKRNNRRDHDPNLAVWEIHPVMQLFVGGSRIGSALPQTQPEATPQILVTSTPVPAPGSIATQDFVTITQPITIKILYGQTVLQPGTRLPVVSRNSETVGVRYMGQTYLIPLSSTNLR